MKVKKIPMRTCIVTREKLPKGQLVRVVRTPEGTVVIDTIGRTNGRGAYLKKDLQVIEKAMTSKVLNRALETEVPSEVFEQLKELV